MEYKLTYSAQLSHHDKDGRDRNYLSFYLNGVFIFKQKIPFDKQYNAGHDRRTSFDNIYLMNGKIYQERQKVDGGCQGEIRKVSYPVSRKKLEPFNIPINLKIHLKSS